MKQQRLKSWLVRNGIISLSPSLGAHVFFLVVTVVSLLAFLTHGAIAQDSAPPQATAAQKEAPAAPVNEKPVDTTQNKVSTSTTAAATAGASGGATNPLLGGRSASAKVGNSGAANFSIPIVVPPGTAGVQPNLSLTYNSQSQENELLGVHWQLSGLPSIERCPRTIAQDNFRGNVEYDANDRFCLDGQRLILVSGATYGADNSEYRTEIDSFVKIKAFGTAGNGPSYFKLWTKAGEVMELGNTADSKVEAAGKTSVRVWALNKMQDVNGNYLTVTYTEDSANGDYRPNRIDYTGNAAGGLTPGRSVQFFYETRTDNYPMYVGGSVIKNMQRLTNVKTYVDTTLVKNYRVIYEYGTATKRSRVTSVQECVDDACATNLPANTFVWQEGGSGFATPAPWASSIYGYPQWNFTGDFNGDGKTDIMTYKSATQVSVHLSTGSGFTVQTWDIQLHGSPEYNLIGDFNGDGKTDVLVYSTGTSAKLYLSSGSNFQLNTWACDLYVQPWLYLGDFDGDGRMDIMSYYNATQVKVNLSSGSGFNVQIWNIPLYPSPTWNKVGDFNGDGKADVLMYGTATQAKIYLSTGTNFQAAQNWTGALYAYRGSDAFNFLGDFNGDGKTDVMSYYSATKVKMHLSTGADFAITEWDGIIYDPAATFLGDFNGDGKTDYMRYDYNSTSLKGYLSTGINFQTPQNWTMNFWGVMSWNFTGDFNGDGKTDLANLAALSTVTMNLANAPFPDLVTSISNGFGGTNTLAYKPITDNSVYVTDNGTQYQAVYPNMEYQQPLYVVSNMTVSDGLGASYPSSYTYGGGKLHHLGRGWLGFRWMESNELTAKVKSKEFLNQTFPFTGTSSESEVYDATIPASPVLFAETWNTFINPAPNPYPGVYFVAPNRVDAFQYDGLSTPRQTARTMEYDGYGNPTRSLNLGDVNVSGDERDERTDWIVDVANWLHRPKRSALYDSVGTLVREKWLYYDNQAYGVLGTKGLVTKEETNAGGGIGNANNPVGTHVYDAAFGIKTSVTDARGCTTTTAYEATKTFPATVTNCLNHQSTMVYDARFGVMTSQTDANGQTTTSTYDSFGRLTKTTGPLDGSSTYGTVTQQYLEWGNPSLQRIKTLRTEQHGTANHI